MNIQIESPHVEARQIPESLLRKKFNRLGEIFHRIEYCKVVLRKEKDDAQKSFFVEAIVKVPGQLLFSSDRDASYEATLDKVYHDIESQLHRYKEKMEEKR